MSGQRGQGKRKMRESRLLTPPQMLKRMGKAQSRQGYALSMGEGVLSCKYFFCLGMP